MNRLVLLLALLWPACSGGRYTVADSGAVSRDTDFRFEFSNFLAGAPEANPPLPASVYVKITKDDAEYGLVSWNKIHKEGGVLGWSTESDGPTSRHVVFSAKRSRMARVDFDTGCVITSIAVGKLVPITVRRCPTVTWPARCPGPQRVKGQARVNEVRYFDAQGMATEYQSGSALFPSDDLCVVHVGDPKTWIETEARQSREQEAGAMLALADDHWLSRNPRVKKQAKEIYARLLKDFAGVRRVSQNLDRIKSRAEAEIADE
jgi:hypothetical protein